MAEIKKPNMEAFTNWKPSAERMAHGRRLYADRLCKEGKVAYAKEYCKEHGIEWPPFSESLMGQQTSAAPVAPVAETKAAGNGHVGAGDPHLGGVAPLPLETAPAAQPFPAHQESPKHRTCEVYGYCVNKRLLRVRFHDNGEEASLVRVRKNYQIGDKMKAELVDGVVGVNPIYREIWNPT